MTMTTDEIPPPPLKAKEAAKLLNISPSSVVRMVGLEWVEYPGRGKRPIRRVTVESVRRLLERRRGV
jgi:hypothetical protein